jgi:hypothetical protein
VIDEDYTGEIKIMTQAPLQPGGKNSSTDYSPKCKERQGVNSHLWSDGGFSSSDHAYWVQKVTKDRPERTLFLNGKWFLGLLDTGAYVSVVAARHWPKSWPW